MISVIFENPSKKGNTMTTYTGHPKSGVAHVKVAGNERLVRIKKLPTLIITADDVEQIDDILAILTRAEENREIDFPFQSRAV
jgi:DNA-binding protein YbaB